MSCDYVAAEGGASLDDGSLISKLVSTFPFQHRARLNYVKRSRLSLADSCPRDKRFDNSFKKQVNLAPV